MPCYVIFNHVARRVYSHALVTTSEPWKIVYSWNVLRLSLFLQICIGIKVFLLGWHTDFYSVRLVCVWVAHLKIFIPICRHLKWVCKWCYLSHFTELQLSGRIYWILYALIWKISLNFFCLYITRLDIFIIGFIFLTLFIDILLFI